MTPRRDPEIMALTTAIHVLVEQAKVLTHEIEQVVDDLSSYDGEEQTKVATKDENTGVGGHGRPPKFRR